MIPNDDPKLKEQLSKIWQQSEERLAKAAAGKQRTAYLDLREAPIQIEAYKLLSEEKAKAAEILVIERKGYSLAAAAVNPQRAETVAVIKELKDQGFKISLFEVSKESLEYGLTLYDQLPKDRSEITTRVDVSAEKVAELEKELTSLQKVSEAVSKFLVGAPQTGEVINVVLAGALTNRASDVHFETADGGNARLRYRIDGVLQTVIEGIPKDLYHLILLRIKLLCNLRLNINTISQDGAFGIKLGNLEIELRVAISPSEFGEAIVMRILDPRSIQITMEQLGFRPDDLAIVKEELKAPNGMILNTGPTGSGKTTTLYAFLRTLATSEVKIITIEDPIEYHLAGIEQTQVNERVGYTFAGGLRSMMRQDPDMILVGEIRDQETAQIALQAALTGHVVFSTLHTNSSAGVIPRLLDLGAQPVSIGPALNLVIAQRLVRKLCEKCKVEEGIANYKEKIAKFLEELPERVDKTPYQNVEKIFVAKDGGCEACHSTGYKGRCGIYELLRIDDSFETLISGRAGEGEIEKFSKTKGIVLLQQDGILKVLAGLTSLEEVESVTGPISWTASS
jgi:type IV pilus assembly protein PilB